MVHALKQLFTKPGGRTFGIVWLGLWPQTVLATFEPALEALFHLVPMLTGGGSP